MIGRTLIDKIKQKVTEKEARKFLEEKGYVVTSPEQNQKHKTSSKDLITLYYKLLNKYHKDENLVLKYIPSTSQDKEDLNSLDRFYLKGEKLGHSRDSLIEGLQNSTESLFQHAKELNINPPPTFSFLLERKYSWIFSAISKIENKKKSREVEKLLDIAYNNDDPVLLKLREEREKMLLGDSNGQKEN